MIKTLDLSYAIEVTEQPEGGYVIQFKDFPEAITEAETLEQALFEAYDCLMEALAARMISKMDIPKPVNVRFLRCVKIDKNILKPDSNADKT